MGKASRAKRERTVADRRGTEIDRRIRLYLQRIGVRTFANAQQLWSALESAVGSDYCEELDTRMSSRFAGRGDDGIYSLLYRDLTTFRLTFSLVAPMATTWLAYFASLELPAGDVLDLGCGTGVSTCFYALERPSEQVLGVELDDAGIARGRELAAILGLTNVEFLAGDLTTVDLGRRFGVVCSTAVLKEVEPGLRDFAPGFSWIDAGRALMRDSASSVARAAARHLDAGGSYVSFERLADFADYASWIGAQQNTGLGVDLDRARVLSFSNPLGPEIESMPAMVSSPGATRQSYEALLQWWPHRKNASSQHSDADVELRLASDTDVLFVRGEHFEVEDEGGHGQTRAYLIKVDEEYRAYVSSSRGSRILSPVGISDLSAAQAEFDDYLESLRRAPDVVSGRQLSATDLDKDLSRAAADHSETS